MMRKVFGLRLEDLSVFNQRLFCDRRCMASWQMGRIKVESPKAYRRQAAKHVGKNCRDCGTARNLNVHPADGNPMNNAPDNLTPVCFVCHMKEHGRLRRETAKPKPPCRFCSVTSVKAGMCPRHYQRFKKHGNPFLTKRKRGAVYVVEADFA